MTDPLAETLDWAHRQIALDRAQTQRFPILFERKRAKMGASPHAFLRGSSPLFYEILAASPTLAAGPEERGWILGDMHLENVGAYRGEDKQIHFDLNDFDDATWAPLHLDLLRLLTSTLLAAQAAGATSEAALRLAEIATETYAQTRLAPQGPLVLPLPVRRMVERAHERTKTQLLDARAPLEHGRRRFVRGERYLPLPGELARLADALVQRFAAALGPRAPSRSDTWRVIDVAQRVAGNGSLGRLRYAILVVDADGEERILDLKEAGPASPHRLVERDAAVPAGDGERMVLGTKRLVRVPPRFLACVPVPELGIELFARQLMPAEDKLEVARLADAAALGDVVGAAATVLARAHGSWPAPSAAWGHDALAALVERAIVLAGTFTRLHLASAWVA